jgi:predicted outer membrane protein
LGRYFQELGWENIMQRRQFLTGLMAATAPMAITRTVLAQPMPAGMISAPQYLTMASSGSMFLEETSRDAYEKTQNPRVRRFARAEVVEQVNLSARLNARVGGVPQAGMAPGGPVGGLVAAPFVAAGAVVGGTVGAAGAVLGVPGAMTSDAQKAQMAGQLRAMPGGPEYDATYVQAQSMGHQEALAIHGSYAQSGDDPGLRRVARSALPLIRLHISQLRQMQGGRSGPTVETDEG